MNERPTADRPIDPIAAGDAHARAGRWDAAIAQWAQAAETDETTRAAVEARLRWLVERAAPALPAWQERPVRLVAGATVAGLLGTMLILLAGEPGTTGANIAAALAWVLFAASATMVVLAARGRPDPDFDSLLRRARDLAARLEASPQEHQTT